MLGRAALRHGLSNPQALASIAQSRAAATLSRKTAIVRRNTARKMKRGLERLPSQGPDPAAAFSNGWRIATAAVLERYPIVVPMPGEFEAEYQTGKFLDEQSKSRPMDPRMFLTEKDVLEGELCSLLLTFPGCSLLLASSLRFALFADSNHLVLLLSFTCFQAARNRDSTTRKPRSMYRRLA